MSITPENAKLSPPKVIDSARLNAETCRIALQRNPEISIAIIDEFEHEQSINNLKWIFFDPICLFCEMEA